MTPPPAGTTGADPVIGALTGIVDAELRDAVVGLFDLAKERVSEGVDLVVLCARRLPCIYTVLLEAGYEPIRGATVVSDRFLDHSHDWAWKNVLILDDTVVLGTTLTWHYNRIVGLVDAAGGGKVSTAAICVDIDKRAEVLLNRISFKALVEATTDRVEEFGKNVVTCLFRNKVPFFSDFPVTVGFAIGADEFETYLEAPGWHLADVTTPLLAAPNQAAYVQLPDKYKTDQVLALLPRETQRLVSAFKVRSYVTRDLDDAQRLDVRLVPLALLVACHEDELDAAHAAFEELVRSGSDGSLSDLPWDGLDGRAKHRVLQLLLSHFVLAASVPTNILSNMRHTRRHLEERARRLGKDRSAGTTLNAGSCTDPTYLGLYFGVDQGQVSDWFAAIESYGHWAATGIEASDRSSRLTDRPQIASSTRSEDSELISGGAGHIPRQTSLLNDDHLRRLLWAQREIFTHARQVERPDRGQMTKVGLAAAHAINSLFGYISTEFEDPQQAEIRKITDYDGYVTDFVDNQDRRILNKVFTMDDLAGALVADRAVASTWDRALVSLGIDVGNDLGIAVPTTRADEVRGLIYRAYRLGETAQLADKPLSMFVEEGLELSGFDDLDEFSRTIADGYPVTSYNVTFALPLAVAGSGVESENTEGANDATARSGLANEQFLLLKDLLQRSLPSPVAARYEGQVQQVEDEWFAADLREIPTLATSYAQIDRRVVASEQEELLEAGVSFRLTVFEPMAGSAEDDIENIRLELHRSRVIEPAEIAQAMEDFAFLATDTPDDDADLDDDTGWDEWSTEDDEGAAPGSDSVALDDDLAGTDLPAGSGRGFTPGE